MLGNSGDQKVTEVFGDPTVTEVAEEEVTEAVMVADIVVATDRAPLPEVVLQPQTITRNNRFLLKMRDLQRISNITRKVVMDGKNG